MAAPGWYPDNHNPAFVRWWDGTRWTEHTQPTHLSDEGGKMTSGACAKWHGLEADAENEARALMPTDEGLDEIRQMLDRARDKLGSEDVREHRVKFNPGMWGLDTTALPASSVP